MLGPTRPLTTVVVGSIMKLDTEERCKMTSEGILVIVAEVRAVLE